MRFAPRGLANSHVSTQAQAFLGHADRHAGTMPPPTSRLTAVPHPPGPQSQTHKKAALSCNGSATSTQGMASEPTQPGPALPTSAPMVACPATTGGCTQPI